MYITPRYCTNTCVHHTTVCPLRGMWQGHHQMRHLVIKYRLGIYLAVRFFFLTKCRYAALFLVRYRCIIVIKVCVVGILVLSSRENI